MSANSRSVLAGFVVLSLVGAALPAPAQTAQPSATPAPRAPRIEVSPRPLLYRRCSSWYVVQYRPSGTVLFPEKHCWWVRG